jgi:hypothetical protein
MNRMTVAALSTAATMTQTKESNLTVLFFILSILSGLLYHYKHDKRHLLTQLVAHFSWLRQQAHIGPVGSSASAPLHRLAVKDRQVIADFMDPFKSQIRAGYRMNDQILMMVDILKGSLKLAEKRHRVWWIIAGRFIMCGLMALLVRATLGGGQAIFYAQDSLDRNLLLCAAAVALLTLILLDKVLPGAACLDKEHHSPVFWSAVASLRAPATTGLKYTIGELDKREFKQGISLRLEKFACYRDYFQLQHDQRDRRVDNIVDYLALVEIGAVGLCLLLVLVMPLFGLLLT